MLFFNLFARYRESKKFDSSLTLRLRPTDLECFHAIVMEKPMLLGAECALGLGTILYIYFLKTAPKEFLYNLKTHRKTAGICLASEKSSVNV